MQSLRELQRSVMHALLDGEPALAAHCAAAHPVAAQIIAPHGIAPVHILGIYANTARTHFIESLQSSYPAIRRLVGDDYFDHCARSFHTRHPSRSGDLQPAGGRFAQHLSDLHGAGEYRYLGDVARLEWLIQETLLAADHEPLDLDKLGAVAPADCDGLRFSLHPTTRLFASEFPCIAIWEANVSDAEPPAIDLDGGPDRALLIRSRGRLKLHRLSPGEMRFLKSVQAGHPFAAAVESGAHARALDGARDAAPDFDPAAALRRFVAAGSIVDFQ